MRMGPPSRLLAVASAVAVAAAGLAVAVPAAAAPVSTATVRPAASSIAFGACTDPDLAGAGAQCGLLSVPLDYSNPSGATIKLAVSRVRHTVPDAQYQGVMLVNPGGPGGSGLGLATLGQDVPNGAGDAYDWIGFDPRGVGSSQPALSCDPNYLGFDRPFYLPVAQSDEQAWLTRSKNYAAACGAAQPALLKHMTTIDSARDMDSIRAALGANQINYYGFSYGTYLGQVYDTLFPSRVRRQVLDSNVDPTRIWYPANLDQDLAFNRNVKIWFGWLAKYNDVYGLGSTESAVEALFYKTAVSLRSHPAGGKIGFDEWMDTFELAPYYQITWLQQAQLFADWIHTGDVTELVNAYVDANGVGDDNEFAVYNGVQCSDTSWPKDWQTWQRDNWNVNARAPFLTWGNAWFNAPCLYWPAPAHTPVTVNGSAVGNILLIDETLDAATPFSGSVKVRQLFPNSRLLALPGGTTHAGSLYGNACEDDLIANYLATGALPSRKSGDGPDATCAPLPQPVPGVAAAAQTGTAGTAGTSGSSPASSPGAGSPAAAQRQRIATLIQRANLH